MHLNIYLEHEKTFNIYTQSGMFINQKYQYNHSTNRSNIAFRSHKYMNLSSSFQTQFSGLEIN